MWVTSDVGHGLGVVFGSFLICFNVILESFWNCFGIVLGLFWDRCGVVLESFWDCFGIILESFWDGFGIVLGSFWNRVGDVLGQSCNSKENISAVNPVTAITKILQKSIFPALQCSWRYSSSKEPPLSSKHTHTS